MTNTMSSSIELINFLNNQIAKIQIGFIERYNQSILLLKKNLIGKNVVNMQFIRTNKTSNRIRDIDVVMDLMIHDIDLAIMFNGLALRINSFGFVSDGLISHAVAVILHENNVISTLIASKISEKKKRQIDVTCLGYHYDVNLLSKEIEITKETQEIYNEDAKVSKVVDNINVLGPEALYSELLDFYRLTIGQEINVPNQNDALRAIEVASLIQEQILSN
jgi:predicted dehydrogenase